MLFISDVNIMGRHTRTRSLAAERSVVKERVVRSSYGDSAKVVRDVESTGQFGVKAEKSVQSFS